MISNKKCAQLARQMAHEIATRGHTRGTSEDLQGKVCLLGALGYTLVPLWEQERKPVWHPLGQLSGGIVYEAPPVQIVREEFSHQFVRFLIKNHPQTHCNFDDSTLNLGMAPAWMAMWNDRVLKTGEETIAWLHKFADAADAAPVGAPVTEW